MTEQLLRDTAALFGEECVDRFETWLIRNQDEDWLQDVGRAFERLPAFCGFVDLRHVNVWYFDKILEPHEYVLRVSQSRLNTWVLESIPTFCWDCDGTLEDFCELIAEAKVKYRLTHPVSPAELKERYEARLADRHVLFKDEILKQRTRCETKKEAKKLMAERLNDTHASFCCERLFKTEKHREWFRLTDECFPGLVSWSHEEETCPFRFCFSVKIKFSK